MSKISVLMAVYNTKEEHLRESIESILNQTFSDFEFIIINNGSTNNVEEVILSYKDKRIKYFQQENKGVAKTRNTLFKIATAEFIAFQDSDDISLPERLEIEYNYLMNNPDVSAVSSAFETFPEKQVIIQVPEVRYFDMLHNCCFAQATCMLRLEDFRKYNLYYNEGLPTSEDYELWSRAIKVLKFRNISNILVKYRVRQDSLSHSNWDLINRIDNNIRDNMLEFLTDNSELTRKTHDLIFCKSKNDACVEQLSNVTNIQSPRYSYSFLEKIFSIVNDPDKKHKVVCLAGIKFKFKKNKKLKKNNKEYIHYLLTQQLDKSNFVKETDTQYDFNKNDTKVIAFYLPQYHDFPENIKWFGKGFSEWSNTSKTVPQYVGHWQPHIPIDVGYYNLNDNAILKRQIELAKKYGIYGFCFYYYWFSGDKLMEKPLQRFLDDKSLDMPFFLFWANEDWSMLWDNGDEKEVLHECSLEENDAEKFMQDILPYMKDERYIKINNKPLMVLYNLDKFPYEKHVDFVKKIRKIAKENGFDDLYILSSIKWFMDMSNLKEVTSTYDIDAMLEFFPQGSLGGYTTEKKDYINPDFKGIYYDVTKYVQEKKYLYKTNAKIFKGLFPNWDNTPRKCFQAPDILEYNPQNYKTWLKDIIKWTKENKNKEEQFVFVNAWNEWAEGAHLEPDQKYGYAYLQATKEALEETKNNLL